MVIGTLACTAFGSTIVFPGESFDAAAVLQAVQDERCTSLYGVPTMFIGTQHSPVPIILFLRNTYARVA